ILGLGGVILAPAPRDTHRERGGAQIDGAPPEADRLAGAEPGVEQRVDQPVALRLLAPEVGTQGVAFRLAERIGLVGATQVRSAPSPICLGAAGGGFGSAASVRLPLGNHFS